MGGIGIVDLVGVVGIVGTVDGTIGIGGVSGKVGTLGGSIGIVGFSSLIGVVGFVGIGCGARGDRPRDRLLSGARCHRVGGTRVRHRVRSGAVNHGVMRHGGRTGRPPCGLEAVGQVRGAGKLPK